VYNLHQRHLLTSEHDVRRGEGREKIESLTLGLEGTNPRIPWKPSTTMLTYRLSGTTEGTGVDHDEPHQYPPTPRRQQQPSYAQSSRTMVRLNDGAGLLTWDDAGV
jgi:hypothetical protein